MTGPFSFNEACRYLFPRTSGPKGAEWSLQPTLDLLESLGHPERHCPALHVGGTNGKGSVCMFLAGALARAGYRVGVFTSPHLVSVRERFVVDGQPISEAAFAMWVNRLHPVIEQTNASFFEITTAIALADFAARGADMVVIEVGLGGRLDSTNVITPLVAGVTNVALDHTAYLGDTLEAIAREKAGIAKPGVPFVIGEPEGSAASDVLQQTALSRRALVRSVGAGTYEGQLGIPGAAQPRNAAVAAAMLRALPPAYAPSDEDIRLGFARAALPGRFQRLGRWVLDVAHNPAAVSTLAETIRSSSLPRPWHVLLGVLGDKAGVEMVDALREVADQIVVTAPPGLAPDRTAWDPGPDPDVAWEPDFEAALGAVEQGAGTAFVTGSFYTVGAAMVRLPGFAGPG